MCIDVVVVTQPAPSVCTHRSHWAATMLLKKRMHRFACVCSSCNHISHSTAVRQSLSTCSQRKKKSAFKKKAADDDMDDDDAVWACIIDCRLTFIYACIACAHDAILRPDFHVPIHCSLSTGQETREEEGRPCARSSRASAEPHTAARHVCAQRVT